MTGIVRTGFVPLAAIALLYVLIPAAHGATIYRCAGSDGKLHYVVSPGAPERCEPMLRYADPRPVAPPPPPSRSVPPVADGKTHAIYRQIIGGIAHYSTTPPQEGPLATVALTYVARCYACDVRSSIDFSDIALDQVSFSAEIDDAATREHLDAAWLRAVIHAESAFDANALSVKGAQGLMQLMPATAARFGASDAFVPSDNIRAGASYLAWLMRRYGGDVTLATAAYNAGEGAVDRYSGIPPFEETRRYVERVSILLSRYRSLERQTVSDGGGRHS